MATTTVYHPTIPDVTNEVEDSAVEAWVEQGWKKTEPGPVESPSEPPRSGAGSGKQAWVTYAEGLGFEIAEGDTRDTIIAKVDAGPVRPAPDVDGDEPEAE